MDTDFSFNLQPKFCATPELLRVVERVYAFRGFPVPAGDALTRIVELCNEGKGWREFRRWLDERGGSYDRRFAEALCLTISLGLFSKEPIGYYSGTGTPHWQLNCMSEYCVTHRHLDGIILRSNDPLWADIYPPNGWCCGCGVMIADRFDVDHSPEITVSAALRQQCRNWLDSDLEQYVNSIWR